MKMEVQGEPRSMPPLIMVPHPYPYLSITPQGGEAWPQHPLWVAKATQGRGETASSFSSLIGGPCGTHVQGGGQGVGGDPLPPKG